MSSQLMPLSPWEVHYRACFSAESKFLAVGFAENPGEGGRGAAVIVEARIVTYRSRNKTHTNKFCVWALYMR